MNKNILKKFILQTLRPNLFLKEDSNKVDNDIDIDVEDSDETPDEDQKPSKSGLKQSELTSSKNLGYAAEWATWEGCSGEPGLDFAKKDKRISVAFESATKDQISIFEKVYHDAAKKAADEVDKLRNLKGLDVKSPRKPDQGTATEKVDIVTSDTDIHVKFNDEIRLAGFQRQKADTPSSKTTKIYDSCIKKIGTRIQNNSGFIDKSGFLRRPAGVKGMSKMSLKELEKAKKMLDNFQETRELYRKSFTNLSTNKDFPGMREEFIKELDDAGIRDAIVDDIEKQLLGDAGRETIYFKYFSDKTNNITLEVHQYDIEEMVVVPDMKETTKFFKVTNIKGDKTYFIIEFRLDGGGHPPQLKVGPDLE